VQFVKATAVEDGTVFHPKTGKNNRGSFVAALLRMTAVRCSEELFSGRILPLRYAQGQDDSGEV
jgi:hypothetical protein